MNAGRVEESHPIATNQALLCFGGELGERVRSCSARLIAIEDLSAEFVPR